MDSGVSQAYYRRFLNQWRQKVKTPRTPTMRGSNQLTEIDGLDGSRMNNFPFSSFKLLGYLQIGLGTICLVLGVVDLFLYLYASGIDDDTLSALTIAGVPIWCGLWFSVTGAMGSCMTLNNKATLTYFKGTFLILSVVCAVFFGPILLGIEIYIVVLRTSEGHEVYEWLIPLLIAFFGFNEMVCAIITASICCCCSPLENAKVRVLFTQNLDELREPEVVEKRRLASPEIFYTEPSRAARARREVIERREPPTQRWVNEQYPTHYSKNDMVVAKPDTYPKHEAPRPEPQARNEPQPVRHEPMDEPDADIGPRQQQPRVALSDDSPPHYTEPPVVEGGNQYRKFKQLMIPGTAGNGEF